MTDFQAGMLLAGEKQVEVLKMIDKDEMKTNRLDYFETWREDLSLISEKYKSWRLNTKFYFLKIFIFFIFLNDISYWFAIAITYPEILTSETELLYYTKIQIPVALLGALFDSLSLYITLLVIRRALLSISNLIYISHLSIDLLIAIAATFWVLFVFSISGWIVESTFNKTEDKTAVSSQSLEQRNQLYADRAISAFKNPTGREEMKNIYFGLIMGLSAIIPTCAHIACALFSLRFYLKR
jgi:hypothetical protein